MSLSRPSIIDDPAIGERARAIREAEAAAMFRCSCHIAVSAAGDAIKIQSALCPVHRGGGLPCEAIG